MESLTRSYCQAKTTNLIGKVSSNCLVPTITTHQQKNTPSVAQQLILQRRTPQNQGTPQPTSSPSLFYRSCPTSSPSHSNKFAAFYPEKAIIILGQNFYANWHDILRALQLEVSDFGSISPLQPNNAILAVENKEQGKILYNIRDWYKIGSFLVKFEPWSIEAYYKEQKIPSYGGCMKVINLPIDRWSYDSFKHFGDLCGVFLGSGQKDFISHGYDGSLFKSE